MLSVFMPGALDEGGEGGVLLHDLLTGQYRRNHR
jgi:hypothetical protein